MFIIIYLIYVDKFIYLLFSNVEKVILKVIKVTVIKLILIKGYIFYVNNSVKLKVLDVIDIYRVIAY